MGQMELAQSKDVLVWRGDFIESAHTVCVAVVDDTGKILHSHRDPHRITNLRSSAKPIQLIPLLQAMEEKEPGFDFSPKELAVMAASHSGTPDHVGVVFGILDKIGCSQDQLLCGLHPPLGKKARKEIGQNFSPIHNNCSGKHSAMLALCQLRGYDTREYFRPTHPVQKDITKAIATVCALPVSKLGFGVDGCGVPVFYLPLSKMAQGYAAFVSDKELVQDGYRIPANIRQRVVEAMVEHPEMVAGEERFDTELMQTANAAGPRLISKVGAEGLGAVGLLDEGLGVLLKVEDGGDRAVPPSLLRVLEDLEVLGQDEMSRLSRQQQPLILNRREEEVGWLEAVLSLDKSPTPAGLGRRS